MYLIKHKMFYW